MTTRVRKSARAAADQRKRVAIYLRQSLDRGMGTEDEGRAVARQLTACKRLAKERGWDVVAVYRDNAKSASGRKPRPEWLRMLADAKAGEFDVIVAMHMDRLTRTLGDYLPLAELAEHHGVGTTTVSGDLDLTTDMGQTIAGLLAVVANGEIKRKGARQTEAALQTAMEGKAGKGPRPFGYENDKTTVRESEAKWVRDAYDNVLSGQSLRSIAAEMNAAGLTTTRGRPWTNAAVRRLLLRERNAGLRIYRGEVIPDVKAEWAGLVDADTFNSVRHVLGNASRRTTKESAGSRRWVGTGRYLCGVCGDGTTMASNYTVGGRRVYVCRTSKHLTRDATMIDEYVEDIVVERLSRDDAADLLDDPESPDTGALRTQARQLEKKLDALAEDYTDGLISRSQLKAGTERARAALKEIDAQTVHSDRRRILGDVVHPGDPDAVRKVWDDLSVDRRGAIIDVLVEITVHKGIAGGSAAARRNAMGTTIDEAWRA